MRRLTLREVNERYGGRLPNDAIFRADDAPSDEELAARDLAEMERTRSEREARPKRQARSERFAVLNAFVDFGIADAGLTPAEIATWLVLFRDTKAEGTARTSQGDIARRANLDVRTVRRAVASLARRGMLQVVRRGRLSAGPSVYRLHPTATRT
jgi:hypothetical protein